MQDAVGPSPFRDLTIAEFVDRLRSAEPVPGGGSASAVAASLGAALVGMVAALSMDRPRYAAHDSTLRRAAEASRPLADRLLALADDDAAAYGRYAAALKMPRETEEAQTARKSALRAAALGAAEVPLAIVEACLDVACLAEALAGRSNVNATSDVGVAAMLAEAGAKGAAANVLINLPSIGDDERAEKMTGRVDGLVHEIEDRVANARQILLSGEQRPPEEP